MVTTERFGTAAGAAAPVIALGAILLATVLSPTFSWTSDALSDLGIATETAALFNGGLIVGGTLTLPFAIRLSQVARNTGERGGAGLFGLTGAALAGVGLFPANTVPHAPAAVAFYLLLSLSLWVYAVGNARGGDYLLAGTTALLGVINIGAWVVWAALFRSVAPGLALPEIVGAFVLGVWAVGTAVRVFRTEARAVAGVPSV